MILNVVSRLQELRGIHILFKVITHHFIYGVHCLAQKRSIQHKHTRTTFQTVTTQPLSPLPRINTLTHRLDKALVRSVCAYKKNCELAKKAGEKTGLEPLMLGLLRRTALQVQHTRKYVCISH